MLWTIAVITPWDWFSGEEDTLYPDEGTVEAETREEAVEKWGKEHLWDRDYCTVSARPKGEPW